jgi:DnaJ-class molecular chaperone
MEQVNYYEVLMVHKGSTDVDIKKAYRKLAMKWHPDKNPEIVEEASKKFQEIGEAYDVLSDPEKRAIYDQYGYEGLRDGIPGQGGQADGYSYKQNAQEIFDNFFGTGNPFAAFGFGESAPFSAKLNKPGPQKGPVVIYDLDCTLAELYNGCTKKFNVTRKRVSPEGEFYDDMKQLVINVKKGWKKGTKVTFPCEGDESKGGIPADIVFVIQEKNSDNMDYSRDGNNLIFSYRISLADALSDCSLQVPTLDGRMLSIACPEVVSPYYSKTVGGEGMPLSKKPDQKGDLIIKFIVLFPKYLNGDKKKKIRELIASEPVLAGPQT